MGTRPEESSPAKQAHELAHLWRHAHGFELHVRVCGGKDAKGFVHKGLADVGRGFTLWSSHERQLRAMQH